MEDYKTIIGEGKDGLRIASQRPEHTWHQYIKLGTPLTIRDQKLAEYARYCVDADADEFETRIRETTRRIAKTREDIGDCCDKAESLVELDNKLAIARAVRQGIDPLIRFRRDLAAKYRGGCPGGEIGGIILTYNPWGQAYAYIQDQDHTLYTDNSKRSHLFVAAALQGRQVEDAGNTLGQINESLDQQSLYNVCRQFIPNYRPGTKVVAAYFHTTPYKQWPDEIGRHIGTVVGCDRKPWRHETAQKALQRLDAILTGKAK